MHQKDLGNLQILIPSTYWQERWVEKITDQQDECKDIDGMVNNAQQGLNKFISSGLTEMMMKGDVEPIIKPLKELCEIFTGSDDFVGIPIGTIRIDQLKKSDETIDFFEHQGLMMMEDSLYLSNYQECIHPVYLFQRLYINVSLLKTIDTNDKIKKDHVENFQFIVPPMDIQEEWIEEMYRRKREVRILKEKLQVKAREQLEYMKNKGLEDMLKSSYDYYVQDLKRKEGHLNKIMAELAD